jgi:hypothetical protein
MRRIRGHSAQSSATLLVGAGGQRPCMFGINEKHLGLIRLSGEGITPYHVGAEVFLETELTARILWALT